MSLTIPRLFAPGRAIRVTGSVERVRIVGNAELPTVTPRPQIMAMPISLRRYTVDELDDFPDDGNRYELLDGILFVSPSPGLPHQIVVTNCTNVCFKNLFKQTVSVHIRRLIWKTNLLSRRTLVTNCNNYNYIIVFMVNNFIIV